MRFIVTAALGAVLLAAPAHAWSDRPASAPYTQPASNEMAIWAYPTKENYCPAGLQPVQVGGVICCGVPTHVGYQSHPAPKRKYRQKPQPYVAYGKGYGDTYIQYGKDYQGN